MSPSRGPGQKRLHVASFPHHATIIAEATLPAVPGRWTLGLGPLLGWTSIGAVSGSHPITPPTPGVTASLEPGAGGQQSPEQTSSLLDSIDLGQRCPGWATVIPGALLGKGPGSSGRSWTRTHAVPMWGCPQPHQYAGLGAAVWGAEREEKRGRSVHRLQVAAPPDLPGPWFRTEGALGLSAHH